MAYNPHFEDVRRPSITFSRTEGLHLLLAVVMLTVAFTFVLHDGGKTDPFDVTIADRLTAPWTLYLASFFAVSSGFVLHELGHKVVAQRYGYWAEFRGTIVPLAVSVAMALGFGFLFALPGAVLIWGRVSAKENGLISLAGPAINFVIAFAAMPFAIVVNTEALFPTIMRTVAVVNAILCVFNLLPFWMLDGRKILFWNKPIYFASLAAAIGLVVFMAIQGLWW